MTDKARGPLTGIHEPEWDPSEPWQLQQSRRVINAFASRTPTARRARRVLWLCMLSALAVALAGYLVLLAIDALT